MLESGLVTTKSVSTIAAKNIGKFAIVSIVFYLFGYNMGYGVPEGGFIGSFSIWTDNTSLDTGYSDASDWFFQAEDGIRDCLLSRGLGDVYKRQLLYLLLILTQLLHQH